MCCIMTLVGGGGGLFCLFGLMCCEFNPSDSVIPAVTLKLNYYVRYRMYTYLLKNSWLFVDVFLT